MVGSPIGFEASPSSPRLDMVPIGGIINWSGAVVDIPSGYQICDGTNGTPNLKNKFVVGAGDTYAVDAAGGDLTHHHEFSEAVVSGTGAEMSPNITGSTASSSNLPPYLALAYIQRMS